MNKIRFGVIAVATMAAMTIHSCSLMKQPVENIVEDVEIQYSSAPTVEVIPETSMYTEPEVVETTYPLYSQEDLETLAIIIYQEAGGDACSDDTRMKVGNVVMNRVASPLFPDSIKEVALQEGQYGNLCRTGIVWPSRADNDGERHAVQRAYDTARSLLEGERVLPENVIWQAGFKQGDGVHCFQDQTYFCYSEVIE